MKFSKETIKILENFASINNSLLFLEGTKQKTISVQRTILASAVIAEEIPKEFGVHDLSKFLSLISLFDDPTIEFGDTSVIFKEGSTKASYVYGDPRAIKSPPKDKDLKMDELVESFTLTGDDLSYLLKGAKILGVPHFVIIGDGENINIKMLNKDNSSDNTISRNVGSTEEEFEYVLDADTLRILIQDYDVAISKNGIVHFTSKSSDKVEYWVPIQKRKE